MFLCKTNLKFLSSIYVHHVDGTFKPVPKFYHQLFKIDRLSNGHYVSLAFILLAKNIQRPMRMYSAIRYQRLQNLA